MATHAKPPIERFWPKVQLGNTCWLWKGRIGANGYGNFFFDGRNDYAHRFAYEHFVNDIPEGLVIDHMCRNRACVNPEHLEAVTQSENLRRSPGLMGRANRSKTHCPKGHPYDEANTYRFSNGRGRACRTCKADWLRRKRKREAEGTAA